MLKNWSKIVLVSMLVLMVAAPVSFATTARVRSLANTGDYMSDDSNAHRWYSVLPSYANQVNAEVGTYYGFGSLMDTRALSVNYACGENGKWGTYRLSLDENRLDEPGLWMANQFFLIHVPSAAGNLTNGVGGTVNTPMNKWDFAGGWEIGENVAVGVSFTRSSWNYESTYQDTTADQSFTTLGIGGTWTNNDDMTGDVSFTWGRANGSATLGTGPGTANPYTIQFDSKNAIEIAGRFMWDWKDNVTVVPVASYSRSDYSLSDNQDPSVLSDWNGDKYQMFHLGVGLNMDVNTDNMLIIAAEYSRLKWEYSNTGDAAGALFSTERTAQDRPGIRLALESSITSWMTTRIGAAKHLLKAEDKWGDGSKTDWENGVNGFATPFATNDFEWSLGVGFNVSEWTIDLELADEAPFSTFYWITGYSAYIPTGPGPVSRISAIYNF